MPPESFSQTETAPNVVIVSQLNASNDDETNCLIENLDLNNLNETQQNAIDIFNKNYDEQIDKISDKITSFMCQGSFFNFGLLQTITFLLVSLSWSIGAGVESYTSVFTGYTPTHHCDINSIPNAIKNPNDPKCFALNATTNETIKCNKWVFDKTFMEETIVTEFDFVCDKNYYFELGFSIEQCGYIPGTIILIALGDTLIARKTIFLFSLVLMAVFILAQAIIVNNYAIIIAFGFVIDMGVRGLSAASIPLITENLTPKKRTQFGTGIVVIFILLTANSSILAYFLRAWRKMRILFSIVLGLLAALSIFLVPESVRWLIINSKISEAKALITKTTKFNRLDRKNNEFESKKTEINNLLNQLELFQKYKTNLKLEKSNVKSKTPNRFSQILKYKKFCIYILINCLNWCAALLVYDGLTYLNNFIGENIFFNFFWLNIIQLPAILMCHYLTQKYGRRLVLCLTFITSGIILFGAVLIETFEYTRSLAWLRLTFFILAKFVISQSSSTVLLYTSEIYPTNLRSSGFIFASFIGGLTSIVAPFVSFYLSKIIPRLPVIIYAILSISNGFISLYLPETLNKSLPNSIEEVVKWSRGYTKTEENLNDKIST